MESKDVTINARPATATAKAIEPAVETERVDSVYTGNIIEVLREAPVVAVSGSSISAGGVGRDNLQDLLDDAAEDYVPAVSHATGSAS